MSVLATATLTITLPRPGRAGKDEVTFPGRLPRVVRLLALAHEIDRRIRDGELADLAAAARAFGLTRARVTQLVNLTLLAPAIQAEILAMPLITEGRDPLTERTLRPIAGEPLWSMQAAVWHSLRRA